MRLPLIALALLTAAIGFAGSAGAAEVNVYSARQEALIRPQLDSFTKSTGIRVNLVTGDAGELVQRLKAEGSNTPADLLFTTDAGNLHAAKQMGLFQQAVSPVIAAAVPAHLRDPDGYWSGLGVRARPIFYVVGAVDPQDIATYESLAEPKLKGKILVRSSNHIYNQSLLASIIAHDGPAKAEAWAAGVAANLARKPQGGDRDQIKAAAAGQGQIVIANSYYYASMLASEVTEEREAARKLKVMWPNQNGRGTHVNVSGAGVTASAKNRREAVLLLEYLVSDEAQKIYAEVGQEYPVKPGVPLSPALRSLGEFKMDQISLADYAKYNADAVRIFDRVGWR